MPLVVIIIAWTAWWCWQLHRRVLPYFEVNNIPRQTLNLKLPIKKFAGLGPREPKGTGHKNVSFNFFLLKNLSIWHCFGKLRPIGFFKQSSQLSVGPFALCRMGNFQVGQIHGLKHTGRGFIGKFIRLFLFISVWKVHSQNSRSLSHSKLAALVLKEDSEIILCRAW